MSIGAGAELERLANIMARLRAEGGCPWDREQDLRSLRPYLIEEAYEVLEEMDRVSDGGSWQPLCEELGDLLFQIVFHAQLAQERGAFTLADVCRAIGEKIESRHPHVFAGKQVAGAEEVLSNWAKLKAEERLRKQGSAGSVLDGVPKDAPGLLRAERLTEKASRIGFDWPSLSGVREKLAEELSELDEAIASQNRDHIEHELGDVLFSVANLARFVRTPPEDALRQAIGRFISRFSRIESGLAEQRTPFGEATLEQMEALWQQAKKDERLIPPPRTLPRAALIRVRFSVADLAKQIHFWNGLAKILGWSITPGSPGAYRAGELLLQFEQGPQTQGAALFLQAPSTRAVEVFEAELNRLAGHSHGSTDISVSTGKSAVFFTDPAGLGWGYGL